MKKKVLLFVLLISGVSFATISCSSDDDLSTTDNGEIPMKDSDRVIATQRLVGIWEMYVSTYGWGYHKNPSYIGDIVEYQNGDVIFHFMEDGTLKVTNKSDKSEDMYLLPTGTYPYKIVTYNLINIDPIGKYNYGIGDVLEEGENMLYIEEIVHSLYNEYPGPPIHYYYFKKIED